MRIGICGSYQTIGQLTPIPCDYIEEGVQDFLVPERPQQEFDAILARARSLPIAVETANRFFPGDLKLVSSPSQSVDAARLERYVRTALARAERSGIEILVFGSPAARSCPSDCAYEDAIAQISDHLQRWGPWARDHGVIIVVEPIRRGEANNLNTVAEAGALVAGLSIPGILLLADTYHMACNGEAPDTALPFSEILVHAHTAEMRDRAAPGTFGEDLRRYFAAFKRASYDRRISIECDWLNFSAQAAAAVASVREQWDGASAGT
jgi:sugar phosphate isomerase/epimerase